MRMEFDHHSYSLKILMLAQYLFLLPYWRNLTSLQNRLPPPHLRQNSLQQHEVAHSAPSSRCRRCRYLKLPFVPDYYFHHRTSSEYLCFQPPTFEKDSQNIFATGLFQMLERVEPLTEFCHRQRYCRHEVSDSARSSRCRRCRRR